MQTKKVNINIVTWNSLIYIENCLASIFKQTFRDFSVLVIDNGSKDGTLEFIEKNYPEVKILKNKKNLGYAKAHNQGLKITGGEWLLIMNPDIILKEDYLEKMINFVQKKPEYQAITGKIKKFHFKGNDLNEIIFTDIIDNTGLAVKRNRNFYNRHENKKDHDVFNKPGPVFGVCGGLLFINRSTLNKIKIGQEYFDEDFFVYKEDIDLAWRMNIKNKKSYYLPTALAYHHRQAKAPKDQSFKAVRKSRQAKSKVINYYSTRNHLLMYLKNEYVSNFFKDFYYIVPRELKRFFYILFFEIKNIKAYFQFFKYFNKMLKKREQVLKPKNIKSIREWLKK
ncbi:MAG: glycosyltransferase family 2 protein [Patescibacteria group bacterium]|nr:glycosyltransferase family 2 protein [Patescibacteria group bacterium]